MMDPNKTPTPAEAIDFLEGHISKIEDTILELRASEAPGQVVWFEKVRMFAVKTPTGFTATGNPLKATPAAEFKAPWMLRNGAGDTGRVVSLRWACERAIETQVKAIDYAREVVAHWRAEEAKQAAAIGVAA